MLIMNVERSSFCSCTTALSLPEVQYFLQQLMYILHGVGNNWALWKVQGQSSQLILSPLAGAAHRSERRRPLISPTSSRCSAREREECKWVLSRKPSPAPSTLKSPTLCQAEISYNHGSSLSNSNYWGTGRGKEGESRILTSGVHAEILFFLVFCCFTYERIHRHQNVHLSCL